MSDALTVRETREVLLARARTAMELAEAEALPHRARIHIAAAERWIALADRKLKRDRREDRRGHTILPAPQPLTVF